MTKFLSFFHRYGYIYKPYGAGGWLSAKEEWRLTDSEILKAIACAHPKYFLGCRADRASKFAVLDIDAGSQYHNQQSLQKICGLLAKAGITETNLYRSSESDGWHLYIFFDAPVSSRDLRNQLVQLLRLHDFSIAKGTLEVFPHVGERSNGQGLRLPLQPGFAWLNPDTLVVRDDRMDLSPYEALKNFLRDVECSSNPYHQFHQLKAHVERLSATKQVIVDRTRNSGGAQVIPIRKSVYSEGTDEAVEIVRSVFQKAPPGILSDIWVRGRQYYERGLTGPSQRADAVYCLSHYLFYGDPEKFLVPLGYGYESERQWAIEEVLKTKHHGFSKDIAAARSDSLKHAERAANWVPPHKRNAEPVKYVATIPVSWARNNANRAVAARKKISQAVAELEASGKPFSMRELRLKASCSSDTLYKHQDLWRPAQERMNTSRLAGDPDEYNAGVGAASQESKPQPTVLENDMPPGRLAARRIVFEIARRARKDRSRLVEAVAWSSEAAEKDWLDRVASLYKENLSEAPLEKLKALAALVSHLLSLAPNSEAEQELRGFRLQVDNALLGRGDPRSQVGQCEKPPTVQ